MIDKDFRDFSKLHEVTRGCPQICCMSATIQQKHVAALAASIGRTHFTNGMTMTPHREALSLQLRISFDPKLAIMEELLLQQKEEKAIVFCLFKAAVSEFAVMLKQKGLGRSVFECVSASLSEVDTFRKSKGGIMVCTSVLAAGMSFQNVSRVFFLDCAHSPEEFMQGAGRGARAVGETCIASLFTSISKLEKLQASSMKSTSSMASFCLDCMATRKDFATSLYGLFEHEAEGPLQSQGMVTQEHRSGPSADMQCIHISKHRRMSEVCASYDFGCYVSHAEIAVLRAYVGLVLCQYWC